MQQPSLWRVAYDVCRSAYNDNIWLCHSLQQLGMSWEHFQRQKKSVEYVMTHDNSGFVMITDGYVMTTAGYVITSYNSWVCHCDSWVCHENRF